MWSLYQSSWGSGSSNSWTCSWLTNIHEVIVRACMWPYMSILYYLKNRGVLSHRLCDEGGKRRCVGWPAYVATSMWRAWVCGPVWATIEPAIYIGRARYTGRQVEFYYQTELRKEQSFFSSSPICSPSRSPWLSHVVADESTAKVDKGYQWS